MATSYKVQDEIQHREGCTHGFKLHMDALSSLTSDLKNCCDKEF